MNKLIIFIGTLQSGGAERVVSEISAMYAEYYHEVIILTYYNVSVFYKIDSRVRVVCIETQTGTIGKIRNSIWLRQFVKQERPTVFLSFLMPFNMMAIVALAFVCCKIVVCERQDPSNVKTQFQRKLRNLLYHFCSRIEVQTLRGYNYFSKSLQKKTVIIPNPNHITASERIRALSVNKEKRVVMVGRLIPLKNHQMVIRVFSRVHRVYPDYQLDIYGEGELFNTLSEQIKHEGLNGIVMLRGRSKDIATAIASARIFIQSSDVEGMPNSLMEAMALGIPSISTDVSGARDIIDDGINGFIIPVNDEASLQDRLLVLMGDENKQVEFSKNTYTIFEKFDRQDIFKLWRDLVTF